MGHVDDHTVRTCQRKYPQGERIGDFYDEPRAVGVVSDVGAQDDRKRAMILAQSQMDFAFVFQPVEFIVLWLRSRAGDGLRKHRTRHRQSRDKGKKTQTPTHYQMLNIRSQSKGDLGHKGITGP